MFLGDYRIEFVPDTEFRLDGGAMFGVVPRALWAREAVPDEENRVRLNANCPLVEGGRERILIETGVGDKWFAKQTMMYAIERQCTLAASVKASTGDGAVE